MSRSKGWSEDVCGRGVLEGGVGWCVGFWGRGEGYEVLGGLLGVGVCVGGSRMVGSRGGVRRILCGLWDAFV